MKTCLFQIKEVVLKRNLELPKALQELWLPFKGIKPGGLRLVFLFILFYYYSFINLDIFVYEVIMS